MLNGIRLAAKMGNHEVNKVGLVDAICGSGEVNAQGENQQKLDVFANKKLIQSSTKSEISCGIVSEEEEFISICGSYKANKGKYVVFVDPLDGSTNIEVNVSVGTIFSIFRRVTSVVTLVKLQDFLQP